MTYVVLPSRKLAVGTVRGWLADTGSPSGEPAERLAELAAVVERLARVMDPSYLAAWLREPVPALDGDKPLEILSGGDHSRVARLVSALEDSPIA